MERFIIVLLRCMSHTSICELLAFFLYTLFSSKEVEDSPFSSLTIWRFAPLDGPQTSKKLVTKDARSEAHERFAQCVTQRRTEPKITMELTPSPESEGKTPVDRVLVEQIQQSVYEGRVQLLRRCYFAISKNKQLLWESQQYPFISQVLQLNRLFLPLTEEEKNKAIDAVIESPVYDRVKDEESKNESGFDHVDYLVKELLRWFKDEFFTWVNKLECAKCGNTDQNRIRGIAGILPYRPEHYVGKASVIERFQCMQCHHVGEFPRYNDICTLLSTRKGRCGEWNNCFIAILRALDVDVRFLWNAEDHVWCEYYSYKQSRWIHLDSCENSYDQPLLYSEGWGKRMSYVFAIHSNYIVDVTAKYVSRTKQGAQLPRNKAPEHLLQSMLVYSNSAKIVSLSRSDALTCTSQLVADATRLSREKTPKHKGTRTDKAGNSPDSDDNISPRQSGSKEWTQSRGEAGSANK